MTKKRSKSLFVVFSIILVICLIACFVNFTYPLSINGNYYSYSSFVSNVKMGEDIGNSLRIVYSTKVPEGEDVTKRKFRHATYDKKNYSSHFISSHYLHRIWTNILD